MKFTALTLAVAGLASAQTWSLCNPVKGDTCPANPAFGGDASYDFRNAAKIDDLESFFIVDGGVKYNPKVMTFSKDTGAKMIIFEENNAPTLTSKNYIFFGKVEVELQAAPGQGIVTSIVLQSDALDEIDWEFVGADQARVQTNFYALGVNDYTRARYYEVPFNPMTSIHTYTIEWTKEAIVFSIDGKVYRTATPAEGNYPQTPMQLKLGTWVGGKGDAQGTIDWAGGLAQWDQAPFAAYYRSLKISDYAGGDKAGATSYEYKKGSDGKWQSIRVNGVGEKKGGSDGVYKEQPSAESTGSVAPTTGSATKAASTASSSPSVSSPPVIADSKSTTTAAVNATLVTRLTSKAESATGSVHAQTTLPSASARPTEPAPAAASSVQGSVFIAGVAAFFAAMML
ncbi:glycosyl hydrolase family 16 protein [Colletotrichum truncatum]|uniref:Glycosyl hydrolase family 16 protein n=1 Tax=Colletotrichum truncatum TaxID=5467 RepID=A0ACC3Z6R0_COLTU|nr:glycosyl hydrolase family 16 protein [Colletotrichum truncatum]KAF6787957.1 glycosyl hydrolase family 16 protein [Colletotrichum truncatum]